jgi:hypothetical protein
LPNFELKAHTNRLTAVEQDQKTEIAEQDAKIKGLGAQNAKLAAIVSKVESLERAVNILRTRSAERIAISGKAINAVIAQDGGN